MPILPTMSQARIISEIRNSMKLHLNSEIQISIRVDKENALHSDGRGVQEHLPLYL